jgi:alkylation response protein AidB-like acyl-CoA dehydrogenase
MKDYACERIYRDARITSIYEGTTQLQIVAAIRHVTTGNYLNQIREYEKEPINPELYNLRNKLTVMTDLYEKAVKKVVETKDNEYIDFHARRMVEMAAHIIMGYLLLNDATRASSFRRSAEVYTNFAQSEVRKHAQFIETFDVENLADYRSY